MIRVLVNETIQIEREKHLNAKPYERSHGRSDIANGCKHKTIRTREGEVTFDIPQVWESGIYLQKLEKGLRSKRGFAPGLAEMVVSESPHVE